MPPTVRARAAKSIICYTWRTWWRARCYARTHPSEMTFFTLIIIAVLYSAIN